MKILDFEQGSQEWLDWRLTGIGASEAPIIFGLSPYMKPWTLYEAKRGKGKPAQDNPAMRKGREYEPIIRDVVGRALGLDFVPICAQHDAMEWLKASLDGWSNDRGGHVLECKYVSAEVFDAARVGDIRVDHLCQMWHQLEVTGAERVTYGFTSDGAMVDYVTITAEGLREIADINGWDLLALERFWLCLHHGAGVCSDVFWEAAQELAELEDLIAPKLARIEQLKEDMKKEAVGSFSGRYALTSRRGAETLDKKAMLADGVALAKYTKTGKPSLVLTKIGE